MDIRNLVEQGLSISAIARQIGYSRKTIRKWVRQPEYQPYRRASHASKLEPHKDYIKTRLAQFPRLSAVRILEEIRRQGYSGKISILRNFMQEQRGRSTYKAVMSFETAAGQQAQVDWGEYEFRDELGLTQKVYGFHLILGYSRRRYLEFTTTMDLPRFMKCHINAFHYNQGCTKSILYDNLKQVVLSRATSAVDSTFNPQFMDFAAYYGFKPDLCAVCKPRTKGKVERTVGYVKSNFFYGRTFHSFDDLNAQARAWYEQVNARPHSTTKEPPNARWEQERSLLTSLDAKPDYAPSVMLYRLARNNCKVSVHSVDYSVPPEFACTEVSVKLTETDVRIYHRGELIATHRRIDDGESWLPEHRQKLLERCFWRPSRKPRPQANYVPLDAVAVERRPLKVYEELV